ncbi:site-specific integrase [Pseudomonas tolaasii]|uniref:site-specific integrase n=1 Tax=Pseudomonas tolaasii TaxID=29442 RepID=UPI001C56B7DA|nr:site-specific integrase [Pseudomonas tolaasii]MBW1247765.1 site-specific integrase [Pseudomonas tolaasii]
MYIEFAWNTDGTPIPHISGRLHHPLADYFIFLRNTSMRRGGRREAATIINASKHMKIWLDNCSDLGVGFHETTYGLHLTVLHKELISRGVKPQSFNAYYMTWRAFYEWCSSVGISHLMQFPPKLEINQAAHTSNNPGTNSTRVGHKRVKDPGLDPVTVLGDFKDVVLNLTQYVQLAEHLRSIDPVYEMIAYSMVTSGLRIGGVMQIPVGGDELNPRWLRYPELERTKAVSQRLVYIPKGKKRLLSCLVLTASLKLVHEKYIKPLRSARAKLYSSKRPGVAPLWLTATGKRVMDYDVWSAFRIASSALGRQICPHHLRHTYATYVVYNYFKAHGLKPNLAYAHDIHEQLKSQLGHSDLDTTKRYIRTVIRSEMEAWLPVLTPHVKVIVEKDLPTHVMNTVAKFFEPGSS